MDLPPCGMDLQQLRAILPLEGIRFNTPCELLPIASTSDKLSLGLVQRKRLENIILIDGIVHCEKCCVIEFHFPDYVIVVYAPPTSRQQTSSCTCSRFLNTCGELIKYKTRDRSQHGYVSETDQICVKNHSNDCMWYSIFEKSWIAQWLQEELEVCWNYKGYVSKFINQQ